MYQIIEVIGMPKRLYHKIWLIMRLTTVILIACLMQVSAAGLAQMITLNQRDVPLSNVLKEIRKQSGFDVFSEGKGLPKNQKVTVVVTNASIEEALDQAFKGLEYTYKIDGKTIAIRPKDKASFFERIINRFQAIDVTGKIVDENGEAIAGATIKVKGTTISTASDGNGIFLLKSISDNSVLEISYLGYKIKEVKAASDLGTLKMEVAVGKLEEVTVNAGYYMVKDRERTGSIARVTSKDIENQPVNNVLSALQGRMAGVNITQNSGNAGGGYDVQIRGRNSLRNLTNSLIDGNTPLYIIDGVALSGQLTSTYSVGVIPLKNINPLNSINPNDIESIDVLKDADATAIYGSRGGNGVILITTKKGKTAPVKLTVNSGQSFSKVASELKMMNTNDYVAMRKQAYSNFGITSLPADGYDINGVWDQNRYTDWQKELIGGTAENSTVQIGISGGSDKNSFSVSAGHTDQASVFPGDHHYKVNTFSGHYNHRSADQRFTLGMSNAFTLTSNNNLNSDYTKSALNLAPNSPALYDANGNVNWENNTWGNPLALLNSSYNSNIRQLYQNVMTSYKPWGDFTVKLNAGINLQELEEYAMMPHTVNNPAFVSGSSSAYSSSSRGTSSVFSYLLEPQIMWNREFGNSEWNIITGLTFQENRTKTSAMSGTGFASNALLHNIAAATTISISPLTDNHYRYAAFFGRVNYQYKNRYILNLTARRDGSSRFGSSNQFANFGALGAAWIISRENFLKENTWLSFAKLRGSLGRTGSDAIGDFQFTNTYSLSSQSYNNIPGLNPSRLYNPNFTWEKTDKAEAALELGLFSDRINLTVAWYRNRSSSQLVGIPLPATTGFTSIQGNLGAAVENSGYEVELGTVNLKSENWKWSTGLNISVPKNKLLAFPGLENSTYANTYVIGKSIYAVKLFDYQGIDPLTGRYRFTDYNNDGKITSPADAQSIKTLGPQYFGGFYNKISYKNFQFSFLLQFVKQENWNFYKYMNLPGTMNNQPEAFLNVWSAQNPNGVIMPYSDGSDEVTINSTINFLGSTATVGDASYLRLKNIQLNYSLPLKNKLINQATVYVQGQNLYTWTKYFGLDPEFVTSGFLPPLKTLSMGLQLTF